MSYLRVTRSTWMAGGSCAEQPLTCHPWTRQFALLLILLKPIFCMLVEVSSGSLGSVARKASNETMCLPVHAGVALAKAAGFSDRSCAQS